MMDDLNTLADRVEAATGFFITHCIVIAWGISMFEIGRYGQRVPLWLSVCSMAIGFVAGHRVTAAALRAGAKP